MSNKVSCRFNLSPHRFLDFFHSTYLPQSLCSLQLGHSPTEFISSVISDIRRRPYKAATSPTTAPFPYMASGPPSALTSRWTTCSTTHISQLSISFRCTYTGFIMVDSPSDPLSSGWNWFQRRGGLSKRPTFLRDVETHTSLPVRTQEISISASHVCSVTSLIKTSLPSKIRLSPLASSWQP